MFFIFLGYKLEFSNSNPISNLLWAQSLILTITRKQTKGLLMMVITKQWLLLRLYWLPNKLILVGNLQIPN